MLFWHSVENNLFAIKQPDTAIPSIITIDNIKRERVCMKEFKKMFITNKEAINCNYPTAHNKVILQEYVGRFRVSEEEDAFRSKIECVEDDFFNHNPYSKSIKQCFEAYNHSDY